MSDTEIFRRLCQLLEEGRRAVLCTLTDKSGSGPRDPGAKMLIDPEGGTVGTIGGGEMERLLVEEAKIAMTQGCPRTVKFALGIEPTRGSVRVDSRCGGEVNVFLDVIKPSAKLLVVGSGHIAKPLASIAHMIGLEVTIIDDETTATPERFPSATKILNHNFGEDLLQAEIRPSDLVAIVHGDADHELAALRTLIPKKPLYIGLLGSRNKVAQHKKQLLGEGLTEDQLSSLRAPIGLDIGAETPEEIAISIVAEIIKKIRNA